MAGISPKIAPLRVPVTFDVRPWLFDHTLAGRAVLPMVEILLLLAAETKKRFPQANVCSMKDGRFVRFLEIPAGTTTLPLTVELGTSGDGSITAILLQKKVLPAMTRMVEYARVVFSGRPEREKDHPSVEQTLFSATASMDADEVYGRYISFGPAYQNLQGPLTMNDREVRARVRAPVMERRCPGTELIGSPFPLDGAMHAAAVFGRQRLGCIPLPVGFSGRVVHLPTRPGEVYTVRAALLGDDGGRLSFDLVLADEQGRVCEEITGLLMREIV